MAEFQEVSHDEYCKMTDAQRAEYDKAEQEHNLDEAARDYLERTDNGAALGELLDDVKAKQQSQDEAWSTGFQSLDDALDGGFMEGELISLGAISSLGKTSLALQIGTAIAEAGKDVLIFSLEMSKKELNAKTISRYSHIIAMRDKSVSRDNRLTHMDILKGRVGDLVFGEAMDDKARLFMDAYAAAQKIASRIRIVVGNNDISVDQVRRDVESHYKATGRRPFVVCDYLQILQPSTNAETKEKRLLTDYDVSTLKTIARDFRVPILTISAFNRTSYLEPVSMSSFRESSGIEYSSDIVLAMQYQGMDYEKHYFTKKSGKRVKVYESKQRHDNRVRNIFEKAEAEPKPGEDKRIPLELKMLKRRLSPKKSLRFTFLPAYNYFEDGIKPGDEYKVDDDLILEWDAEIGDEGDAPAPAPDAGIITDKGVKPLTRAQKRMQNYQG